MLLFFHHFSNILFSQVCAEHGATVKQCTKEGCNGLRWRAGLCYGHSDEDKKKIKNDKKYVYKCKVEGCTKNVVNSGVCLEHGAKKKIHYCKHPSGCTKQVQRQGLCAAHGGRSYKPKEKCEIDGCTNIADSRGKCRTHYLDPTRVLPPKIKNAMYSRRVYGSNTKGYMLQTQDTCREGRNMQSSWMYEMDPIQRLLLHTWVQKLLHARGMYQHSCNLEDTNLS